MSKQKQTRIGRVRSLLQRPSGVSLEAICKATGWQAHSARAALSTLRKKGAHIERREAKVGGPATYHLVAEPEVKA